MKLFTLAASASNTIQLNYCPETLLILSNAAPAKVQVRALGEGVILDLDATGAFLMRNIRDNKAIANNYKFRIADGLLVGKNIEIEVTAGAAQTVVYCYSTGEKGENYVVTERNTVLANTSQQFKKFFTLALSDFESGDMLTVEYADGTTQLLNEGIEIQSLCAETHQDILLLDNLEQDIRSVTHVPQSDTTVYIQRLKV